MATEKAALDHATAEILSVVDRFNEAFNRHDVDGIMDPMSNDCVFESTGPQPDGEWFTSQAAMRDLWNRFFASTPTSRFETGEIFAAVDWCVVRRVFNWTNDNGQPGHVRGVDLFKVRNGKVAEKLAYEKG